MSASEVKTIMLRVNADDAEEKINELRNNLKKAREDKMALYERNAGKNVLSKEDKASIDKLNKDIQQAEKELRRMNISGGEVEDTLSNISKKNFKDLKRAIKAMTDTLNRGEIKRGSDEWNKLTAAIRRAKEKLKNHGVEDVAEAITGENTYVIMLYNYQLKCLKEYLHVTESWEETIFGVNEDAYAVYQFQK